MNVRRTVKAHSGLHAQRLRVGRKLAKLRNEARKERGAVREVFMRATVPTLLYVIHEYGTRG
jgi:hypothetical protein